MSIPSAIPHLAFTSPSPVPLLIVPSSAAPSRCTPRRPRTALLPTCRRTSACLMCAPAPGAGSGPNSNSNVESSAKSVRRVTWRSRARTAALISATVAAICVIAPRIPAVFAAAEAFIGRVGVVRGACALFVLNFCTVLFCFPANMVTMITSATLLGATPAFMALYSSKLAAACVAFLLARGVLAPRVTRALTAYPRIATVFASAGSGSASVTGWRFVLLTRLSPMPGFALNYLLSLTKVAFWQYAAGTAMGIVPSVLNLCLIGAAARDAGSIAAGASVSHVASVFRFATIALMLLVSIWMTRNAKKLFGLEDIEQDTSIDLEKSTTVTAKASTTTTTKTSSTNDGTTAYLAQHS